MIAIRLLAPSLFALAIVSCAQDKGGYDTPPPAYGPGASVPAPGAPPANPIYDTPAAYEEATGPAVAPEVATGNTTTAPTPPPANGAAIIHTVVKGDTLSGISAKYKVPSESIKRANHMTNDIVVLGRKMVIPPQ